MPQIPENILAIQKLVIEPEEVLHLVREMTRRHDSGSETSYYTSLAILFDRYPGDTERVFCISERMRCLVPMMADARMRGWSMESPDPATTITEESVFRAVAKCPLRVEERRIWFDADEFFRIVLEETRPATSI